MVGKVSTSPAIQASKQAGLTKEDWYHRALKGPDKALNVNLQQAVNVEGARKDNSKLNGQAIQQNVSRHRGI